MSDFNNNQNHSAAGPSVLIAGGDIVDPTGRWQADIVVRDGVIAAVGSGLDRASADIVLDATGCVVASGFVDLGANVGEPGNDAAETVRSAAWGAAVGGYTTIHANPTAGSMVGSATGSVAVCDSVSAVRDLLHLAASAPISVRPIGAITQGCAGSALAPMYDMAALGVSLFSNGGRPIGDAGLMRRIMQYATGANITLMLHPEAADIGSHGVMNEGRHSSTMAVAGRPSLAEELGVGRDLALARATGARVHMHRISTRIAAELIAAAKADGVAVTCDATPHHLALTDEACLTFDTCTRVSPPLRTDVDVAALAKATIDGTLDAIVSDHTPCVPEAKELPFDTAPEGSLGLETAFAVAWTALDIHIEQLLTLMSWQPAQIAGLGPQRDGRMCECQIADIVCLELGHTWTVSGQHTMSPSRNSIFEGRTLTGRVRHTIAGGIPVVVNAEATR